MPDIRSSMISGALTPRYEHASHCACIAIDVFEAAVRRMCSRSYILSVCRLGRRPVIDITSTNADTYLTLRARGLVEWDRRTIQTIGDQEWDRRSHWAIGISVIIRVLTAMRDRH
jgi:hypothetical protein